MVKFKMYENHFVNKVSRFLHVTLCLYYWCVIQIGKWEEGGQIKGKLRTFKQVE